MTLVKKVNLEKAGRKGGKAIAATAPPLATTVESAMNQLVTRERVDTPNLLERRRNERYKILHILAITGRGTGQIIDIGREGLSFGCLYPHAFPESWSMDILDARGSHIKELRVRKIWEKKIGHPNLSPRYELEVGVEFADLTEVQAEELDFLLDNLDLYSPSSLLEAHRN